MPKSEITWKRVTDEGENIQVNAQKIGKEWIFSRREKRFDQWQPLPEPPLEDWLMLLDSIQRMITRRRLQPVDEDRVRARILERFPDAEI